MNVKESEDIKNIALKLNEIRQISPKDYYYLKGWINCLSQKSFNGIKSEHTGKSDCDEVIGNVYENADLLKEAGD